MASIAEILAKKNRQQPQKKKPENEYIVQMIHYKKLIENEENFYSTKDVESLADSIVLAGEIKQPLLVTREEPGTYKIIAGHRRFKAAKLNIERGHKEFEFLPCKIEDTDELLTEFDLIITNSTQRERNEFEKMKEVQKLKEIIPRLAGNEQIKGRALRSMVADGLNISETKVANYDNISKNLISEGMERFASGEITVSAANELAGMQQDEQQKLLEENQTPSYAEVKQKKEELETPPEITAIVTWLGSNVDVKDILRYVTEKESQESQLKSILSWKSDDSYWFSTDGVTLKAIIDGKEIKKVYAWPELIRIWTQNLKYHMENYKELSPKETEYVVQAIKEQLLRSAEGDLTEFVAIYSGYEDVSDKIALLKEYLVREIYRIDVDGHSVHFKDYRVSFTRAGATSPCKMIDYNQLCNIVDTAIDTGEISKVSVSDSDTKEQTAADNENTNVLEHYECENQMEMVKQQKCDAYDQKQSERLVLKNDQERTDFLESWKNWPLWFESPQIEARYYRYMFDDGSYIVAVSYRRSNWSRYSRMKEEEYGRANMHLVKVGENYYGEYTTSRTDLIEHIKAVVPRK